MKPWLCNNKLNVFFVSLFTHEDTYNLLCLLKESICLKQESHVILLY